MKKSPQKVRNDSLVTSLDCTTDAIPVVGKVRMGGVPRFTGVGTRMKSPEKKTRYNERATI